MTLRVSTTAQADAYAAASAAADGAKDAAYLDSLITSIGSGYKRVIRRNSSVVWTGTASSSLVRSGTQLSVSAITAAAAASADINSGTWTHRIEKSSDANVYIEADVGPPASGLDAIMSTSLVSGGTAICAAALIDAPGFDTDTVSVDTMIAHMGANAVALPGAADRDAMKGGYIVTGADLRSVVVPSWWGGNNFSGSQTYWRVLQPWYVIWDVQGHQAGLNTRLKVKNLKLYSLETGDVAWNLLSTSAIPPGDPFNRDVVTPGGSGVSARPESDGWSVKITPGGAVYHGYQGQVSDAVFTPADLLGLHVSIEAQKILDDPGGTDDRASARYAVQVGLDAYVYPGVSFSNVGALYWPGVGASAFIEITATSTAQKVYFSTIAGTRSIDTSSAYNSKQYMTQAAFRALPPPA